VLTRTYNLCRHTIFIPRNGPDDTRHQIGNIQRLQNGSHAHEATSVSTMTERSGRSAFLGAEFADAVDVDEYAGEDHHLDGDNQIGDCNGEVFVVQFGGGVEIAGGS
jgi:hypothetical protein